MRILLIKTSSMGDIIHTLPALTDAGKALSGITIDWVVEDTFAEIPAWHPLVDRVIPVALRRWRKGIFSEATRAEWKKLRKTFAAKQYDLILDAQSLIKSAFLSFFAQGTRAGLDWRSARESFAAIAYQRRYQVNFYQHAVIRMRSLFSQALSYSLPTTSPDFGLAREKWLQPNRENYVVFLHGTTWDSKLWPEAYWIQLADLAGAAGYRIKISGGNDEEVKRAERIAKQHQAVDVMPRLTIMQMAILLANAKAAIAVDTGFGHLASALDVPTVSLYGPTNPIYTGAVGKSSLQLAASFSCAPCLGRVCTYRESSSVTPACFSTLSPHKVWDAVQTLIK